MKNELADKFTYKNSMTSRKIFHRAKKNQKSSFYKSSRQIAE